MAAQCHVSSWLVKQNDLLNAHARYAVSMSSRGEMAGVPLAGKATNSQGQWMPARRASLQVKAGKCPFGFHGDAIKEGRQVNRLEALTLEAPTRPAKLETTPYAPAPSTAPDVLPIGPGNYEYLPFKVPYKMIMGLEPMNPGDFIEIDMFYDDEMALRREILNTRNEVVVASMPVAKEANKELLEILANFLPARFPDRFVKNGTFLTNRATGESFDLLDEQHDALEVSSRLVQEDLCLMMDVDGVSKFVSGAVLFPQRWQLLEKLGMDLHDIHKPVPLYEKEISKPVDGFMQRIKVGMPWTRANWAIVDDPTLFQPLNEEDIYAALAGRVKQHEDPITVENAGDRLFTRCERETFTRFPRTGAVLFTIRTYIKPLRVFAGRPALAAQFVKALDALPESMIAYKTMAGIQGTAREYLERCAASNFVLPSGV